MRRQITILTTLALVGGILAAATLTGALASPAGAMGQTDTIEQPAATTAATSGDTIADASGDATHDADTTTDGDPVLRWYSVDDPTVTADERLGLQALYQGSGEGPSAVDVAVDVDGTDHELGQATVHPGEETVAFEPTDVGAAADVDISCEFGWNEDDGWYLHCEITFDVAALEDVDHEHGDAYEVRLGDSEPTSVLVADDLSTLDDGLVALDYRVEDRVLHGEQPLELRLAYAVGGDEPAARDVVASLDGDRRELGRLSVDPETDGVDFEPSEWLQETGDHPEEPYCWSGAPTDPQLVRCYMELGPLSAAENESDGSDTVDVGVDDLQPTSVTVEPDGDEPVLAQPAVGTLVWTGDDWDDDIAELPSYCYDYVPMGQFAWCPVSQHAFLDEYDPLDDPSGP
ncbi:hypothetical protein [Halovivax cerinus]|uniref:Uncharacterized protein n=1 Tax=Halovivax cerinus TaxID=1487865 RepID=A0ABD5NT43_9EURY|nr:hypothetical protein [Halovivax cerinus]